MRCTAHELAAKHNLGLVGGACTNPAVYMERGGHLLCDEHLVALGDGDVPWFVGPRPLASFFLRVELGEDETDEIRSCQNENQAIEAAILMLEEDRNVRMPWRRSQFALVNLVDDRLAVLMTWDRMPGEEEITR